MQHILKNISGSVIHLGGFVDISPGASIVIYDDVTFALISTIDFITLSLESDLGTPTYNLNYCFHNSLIEYRRDASLSTPALFYSFYADLKHCLEEFKKYSATGLIEAKLDVTNKLIIIGNRAIAVSDLPNNIPATKIANGSISDAEFQTLNNINTGLTIQQQLDGKVDIGSTTFTFFLSTPSLTWNINHGLGIKPPSIQIRDTSFEVVLATIRHIDNNNIQITFSKLIQAYASISI